MHDEITKLLLTKLGEIWTSRSRRGPNAARFSACNSFEVQFLWIIPPCILSFDGLLVPLISTAVPE